jgi:hypothetical protein
LFCGECEGPDTPQIVAIIGRLVDPERVGDRRAKSVAEDVLLCIEQLSLDRVGAAERPKAR